MRESFPNFRSFSGCKRKALVFFAEGGFFHIVRFHNLVHDSHKEKIVEHVMNRKSPYRIKDNALCQRLAGCFGESQEPASSRSIPMIGAPSTGRRCEDRHLYESSRLLWRIGCFIFEYVVIPKKVSHRIPA